MPVDGPASSPLGSAPVYLSGTGCRHPPARGTVAAMLGALRRRWLIAGAVVLVLVALAAGILVAYRLHQERNIKGSSTVEFTTTTSPKKPVSPPKPQGVVWPLWGYDPPRTRAPEGIKLLPPYRAIWTFNARQLLEFPPAIAYGRLYINSYDGVFYALNEKTGKRAVALQLEPLRRLHGRRRPRRRLRDVHRPAALQQAEPGRPRARGGVQRAHRQAPLALPGRPRRDLAPARQRARLRRELGRRGVGDRPEDRRPALALQDRRPGQGLRRTLRLERDRRGPTTATSTPSTPSGASRSGGGRPSRASACRSEPSTRPPQSPTAASTSATPTARSTRTGRRPASSAGRTRPAATSTHRPASGTSASTPAPTTARSTPSTPRPATRSGRSRPRARSRARRRSSTASSTSRASRTAPMRSTPPPGSSSGASGPGTTLRSSPTQSTSTSSGTAGSTG